MNIEHFKLLDKNVPILELSIGVIPKSEIFLQLPSQACHGAVGSSIQQSETQCLLNLTMTRNIPPR